MQHPFRIPGVLLDPPDHTPCPLCSTPLTADELGLIECPCGWGGPGDPLERVRGLRRALLRLDRRAAAAIARAGLRRLARGAGASFAPSAEYLLLVLAASMLTYGVLALIWLRVITWTLQWIAEGALVGICIGVAFLALLTLALLGDRRRRPGIAVDRERFPQLFAALDDARARVGLEQPCDVIVTPDATLSLCRKRGPSRRMRSRLVLRLGAAAFPLLTDAELKALLVREFALRDGGFAELLRLCAHAETLLSRLINTLFASVKPERTPLSRSRSRVLEDVWAAGSMCLVLGFPVVWVLTLPLRLLLAALHLLRLPQTHAAVLAADAVSVHAYGPPALANGLTGLLVAQRTLDGTLPAIRDDMLDHGEGDFYAAMTRHYDALPRDVVRSLRREALVAYRSLRQNQPILADRLRAANLSGPSLYKAAPEQPAPAPAMNLLRPADDAAAGALRLALTALLLTPSTRPRRRWWQRQ